MRIILCFVRRPNNTRTLLKQDSQGLYRKNTKGIFPGWLFFFFKDMSDSNQNVCNEKLTVRKILFWLLWFLQLPSATRGQMAVLFKTNYNL